MEKPWYKFWGNPRVGSENRHIPNNAQQEENKDIPEQKLVRGILPTGASSIPDFGINGNVLSSLDNRLIRIEPDFIWEIIPLIRRLTRVNEDVSQAFTDTVQLANTGFKILFDPTVSADLVDKMRVEVDLASKNWGDGVAGLHGITNKMFSQLMVGGAISNEWIPSNLLTGIENIRFVNPENIRWVFDKSKGRYKPFQLLKTFFGSVVKKAGFIEGNLIPLNTNTYKYFGLNGDEDVPYGIPPYWSALGPVETQAQMVDNIKFVSKMLGILGYMNATIEQPEKRADESEKAYNSRLEQLLDTLKQRVQQGFRDGVNVGFKDDTEFDFTSASKDVSGAKALFDINENLLSSGLKFDQAFMGRAGGSETLITILFTKMLSQLVNMQNVVKENLIHGITLHLRLRGFKFNHLNIEFNKSTITDELKYQQAQQYKIQNNQSLYEDGITSQEQYADNMGYKAPDQPEPRLPLDQRGGSTLDPAKQAIARGDQKDTSDRKQRDKAKPQGSKNVPTKTRP